MACLVCYIQESWPLFHSFIESLSTYSRQKLCVELNGPTSVDPSLVTMDAPFPLCLCSLNVVLVTLLPVLYTFGATYALLRLVLARDFIRGWLMCLHLSYRIRLKLFHFASSLLSSFLAPNTNTLNATSSYRNEATQHILRRPKSSVLVGRYKKL